MPIPQRIAFLGAGNMTAALIEGVIAASTCAPDRITATDVRPEALDALAKRFGIGTGRDNAAAARAADVVVLSVKPQVFGALLPEIAGSIGPHQLVVSIAAGVPIDALEGRLAPGARVVRAMPNTPALVRCGATALAAGSRATHEDLALAEQLFRSVGIALRVPEAQMDAVTALSGSGPAYVFYLVEALTEAGVRAGLPAATAAALTAQTVLGAARMLSEGSDAPEELRRKVTSPGGTTAAGIAQFDAAGLREIVARAVEQAKERGRELGAQARAQAGAGPKGEP
jgi:pyrroline-5-carboxylate reductase